jgi:DNA-binding NarL/FixJ family response regulator
MQVATERPRAKRAAIIEPQSLFLPYLVSTLRRTGLEVVRAGPRIGLRNLARLAPDVVLVGIDDVPAPLNAIRRLRRLLPPARIVVYTHAVDAAWARLACAIGADAIVGPDDDERQLVSACSPDGARLERVTSP